MKVKPLQILICLFVVWSLTVSCKQESSFNHNNPVNRNYGPTHNRMENIRNNLSDVNNRNNSSADIDSRQSNVSRPNISNEISHLDIADLELKVRRWAANTRSELDNGVRDCHAWTVIQCKLTISEYEGLILDWIRLPLFERAMLGYQGRILDIESKVKKWTFGEVALGSDFINILDEVIAKDQEVLPGVIRDIIDNEVYPSLSDMDKVDQWAADAIKNFERRKDDKSLFNSFRIKLIYGRAVRKAQLFLQEWVEQTPDQRDSRRFNARLNGENIREPIESLYEENETLRALWQLIEARDMSSGDQRRSENQRVRMAEFEAAQAEWLAKQKEEILEGERLEAEAQSNEIEEKIAHWEDLSFEEKQTRIGNNESIIDQINMEAINLELRERVEAIQERDRQARNERIQREREERQRQWERERQEAKESAKQRERAKQAEAQRLREMQQQIDSWRGLSFEQRESQRRLSEGLTDQIDIQGLSSNLREQIETIENNDSLTRDQSVRAELDRRKNMSYEERSGLQVLEDQFDVLRLSEDIQREIDQLRENDREIRSNRRRAGQLAAATSRAERLELARQTIRDQSIVGYRRSKVKLWPIRCGKNATYRTVYPYTDDTKPIHVNLSSSNGLRLEVHSNTSKADEFMLIDGELRLQINAAYDLYNEGNYIEYESRGRTQIYRLNRLIDIQGKKVYHIKVRSQKEEPIRVRWEEKKGRKVTEIDRSFRGDFRIEITERRSSEGRIEWSLINDLPVEWYIRSVGGSEVPPNYTINAHSAQVVAARSYYFNKALEDRNVQARGWDIDPTQCNQVYRGIEQERQKSDLAVSETAGLILTYNNRLIQTQYYACGRISTKDGTVENNNPIEKPRNIPSNITCSGYRESIIDNHGYGMPQFVANELTKTGWENTNNNSPTEEARVPEDIHKPWEWRDVLYYFYPDVEIKDFRNL